MVTPPSARRELVRRIYKRMDSARREHQNWVRKLMEISNYKKEEQRCKTCKYFSPTHVEYVGGHKFSLSNYCENETVLDYIPDPFVGMSPDEDFGCVLWKEGINGT